MIKQRIFVAGFTALVFGAGYGAALWLQPAVPPPPAAIGAEFAPARTDSAAKAPAPKAVARPPKNRAELAADIERLRPQIDAFRARLEQIEADFERDLVPVLTEEQARKHTDRLTKRRLDRAKKQPSTEPLTDEQIEDLSKQPLNGMLWIVVLDKKVDELNREVKLDDAQREKVRDLLRVRRDKFLALVDSSSPPSLMLSRLAPVAQRLAAPTDSKPAPKK